MYHGDKIKIVLDARITGYQTILKMVISKSGTYEVLCDENTLEDEVYDKVKDATSRTSKKTWSIRKYVSIYFGCRVQLGLHA